jgi:hypothetical protein
MYSVQRYAPELKNRRAKKRKKRREVSPEVNALQFTPPQLFVITFCRFFFFLASDCFRLAEYLTDSLTALIVPSRFIFGDLNQFRFPERHPLSEITLEKHNPQI